VTSRPDLTAPLSEWGRGNSNALNDLLPLVYAELRRIAADQLGSGRVGHTLRPTASVHEVYLRLIDQRHADWRDRAHFFGAAAQVMRRTLVDEGLARVVELRAFGGLTIEETACVLKVSPTTAKREWRTAKSWLTRELGLEGQA